MSRESRENRESRGLERVLVVDDDAAVRQVLAALLVQAGFEALRASSGEEALRVLERSPVDVVVSDVRMPGLDGLALLERVRRDWPEVPVILLTAHASVALAVEAMKAGAHDFLEKPFDREGVLFVLRKALSATAARRDAPPRAPSEASLLGVSSALDDVRQRIRRAAASNATVLIRGETGTGKELVARSIHAESARRQGPFVALNCAAVPENLLESELFGYEKGAFTGAASRKPGRVELSDGGTLFLDEIGDVSLSTQVKLLRVLQERAIERLGGTNSTKVDVRFVAATHRNLEELMSQGKFREDFFYRLNVVPIEVPPLRERAADIDTLARHFCQTAARANGRARAEFEPGVTALLASEPWPGNVRQLENFVERLVVLSDGPTVTRADVERELSREAGRRFPNQKTPSTPPTSVSASGIPGSALGTSVSAAGTSVSATGTSVSASGTAGAASGISVSAAGIPGSALGTSVSAAGTRPATPATTPGAPASVPATAPVPASLHVSGGGPSDTVAASAQKPIPPRAANLAEQRAESERQAIREALERARNNRSLAARLLGISRRTLYNKLEELGIA